MMEDKMEFFSNIGKIEYKGKDSTDPLSFKYYNPDEMSPMWKPSTTI